MQLLQLPSVCLKGAFENLTTSNQARSVKFIPRRTQGQRVTSSFGVFSETKKQTNTMAENNLLVYPSKDAKSCSFALAFHQPYLVRNAQREIIYPATLESKTIRLRNPHRKERTKKGTISECEGEPFKF